MEIKPIPTWHEWLLYHTWMIEIGVALLLLLFLSLLFKRALSRSKQKGHLQGNDWRIHIDSAALAPARALLWVLLIAFATHLSSKKLGLETLLPYVPPLRNAGIVFCLAWFLLRWKKYFHNAMAAQRIKGKLYFDPVSLEIIGKIFSVLVVFVSLLIILGLFGLDIYPLVTFGGIGAAALGLASRDIFANFFGGLMLYVNRPFTTNDLIEVPAKKILGNVEQIGWYLTVIRDGAKKPVYVPNSLFSTELVVNLSRITHRALEEKVRLRYVDYDKIASILSEVRTLVECHPAIDSHQSVHVFLHSFGPYALELEVRAYTLTTRYEEFMEIRQKILLEIASIITKSGAEIATDQVHLSQ